MFSWLRRKCSTVLLGFNLSVDVKNRSVIESQRLREEKKWPYLVCLFTWLAGLVSEGHEGRVGGRCGGQAAIKVCCFFVFLFCTKDQVLQCKHSRGKAMKGSRLMAACVALTAASPAHKSFRRGRKKAEDRVK